MSVRFLSPRELARATGDWDAAGIPPEIEAEQLRYEAEIARMFAPRSRHAWVADAIFLLILLPVLIVAVLLVRT